MSYQRGVRPDYTVGTITLVSNSKNFTTVGASLKTATIGSGDTIMTADGRVLIISEITGQNAGVLAYPCPASAAGTNLPLRIRFQPSSSGVQGAVRDLLERWGMTGNIDAIAGLETAKDMMAYFTGAGTADLTVLTALGRALLASTNTVHPNYVPHVNGSPNVNGWARLTTALTGLGNETGDGTIGLTGSGSAYIMYSGSNIVAWDLSGKMITGVVPVGRVPHLFGTDGDGYVRIGTVVGNSDLGGSIRLTTGHDFAYNYNGEVRLYCSTGGNMSVAGSLSKGSGTFLIDHPLDPENKDLAHGFVEAPEYVNIYRGETRLVRGRATVNLDEYFNMTDGTFWALNTDITISSLQNQEGFARLRPLKKMESGIFEIICEDEESTDLVSWMVTGRRKDNFVLYIDENCERETGKFITEREKEDFNEVSL